MESIQNLMEECLLKCDNYVKIKDKATDWLNLVTSKSIWKILINSSFDNNKLKIYFKSLSDEERIKYFKFGISSLFCFIQANFTGPALPENIKKFLESSMFKENNFSKLLIVNNEEINVNTLYPILLVCAETIFDCCILHELINLWWSFRTFRVHQEVLDEHSTTLLLNGERCDKIIENHPFEGHLKAKYDIEMAQYYLTYKNIAKANRHLNLATELLGLDYKLSGMLGKRTKYQEKDIAQLALEVSLLDKAGIERPVVPTMDIPKNISLRDDVRLDQTEFVERLNAIALPNTEQQLLLSIVQEKLVSTPPDELQFEELEPFLNLILSQVNTYSVRVAVLLLRSRLESKGKRTIERCFKQCDEIINCFNAPNSNDHLIRISNFFCVAFPPIWKIQAQMAHILLNLGLVQNSLDIYLKIKLWEEVIICYTILNRRQKAAETIREQLEINPSVKMMCLLGDATDDENCYMKAWEMSRKRSHRAQRHWGQFLFERKKYKECLPHFEKSLSINPLQPKIWLRLGFAALESESWQSAATAYRRYVNLEPEGFEAWNNLAQAYLKLGNKHSAHYALLEALKHNFDNWKVWENLLVVSCDISKFFDVIRAYHRVLDLKEKYVNPEALTILACVCVCNKNTKDSGQNLLQKTQELFGRITAIHTNDGFVWKLYASLTNDPTIRMQRLQRAYRGYAKSGWDKNPEVCLQVLEICLKLAETVLENQIEGNVVLNSVKLNLKSVLAAVKKQDWEETKDLVATVSSHYDKIVAKVDSLQPAPPVNSN